MERLLGRADLIVGIVTAPLRPFLVRFNLGETNNGKVLQQHHKRRRLAW